MRVLHGSPLVKATHLMLVTFILLPLILLPSTQKSNLTPDFVVYLILLLILCYSVAYLTSNITLPNMAGFHFLREQRLPIKYRSVTLLMVYLLLDSSILLLSGGNLKSLLFRDLLNESVDGAFSYVLLTFMLRPMLFYLSFLLLIDARHSLSQTIARSCFLIPNLILFCFPLALPRLLLLMFYVPMIFIVFKRLPFVFVYTSLFVIPYIGFITEPLRYFKCKDLGDMSTCLTENPISFDDNVLQSYVSSGHFDFLPNFSQAFAENIQFGCLHVINIIFSSILPRSIYPMKTIDSGFLFLQGNSAIGNNASNVSFPLFAEIHASGGVLLSTFWLIAVLIYISILNKACLNFVSFTYFGRDLSASQHSLSNALWITLIVSDLYIYRGSLLSAITAKHLIVSALILASLIFNFLRKSPPRQIAATY